MLNKDQYNEDVYNDYYAQATEGAEIKHGHRKKGKSKLLLIFLLLSLIGVLSYFVWENLNSVKKEEILSTPTTPSNSDTTTNSNEEESLDSLETALEKSLEEGADEEEPSKEDSSNTTQIVSNIAKTSNSKMSPADIARIVQLVTKQMQEEKKTEEVKNVNVKVEKDSLEKSLENFEIDTLSSQSPIINTNDDSQKKEATLDMETNTYNKVVVQESSKNIDTKDELSQLSMEISNVINSDNDIINENSSTYTSSLSKEAEARNKEMRYHIVKKGDTLAGIALKIYGSSKDYIKLYKANPDILRRADKIYIGQRLRIPE